MANKKPSSRPDIATLGGLALAGGCILGGLVIEGGKLTDIAQVTALMIVLGGTVGAVMVTTPWKTLIRAFKYLGNVFFEQGEDPQEVIEEIIAYATKARKNSIISLEADLPNIADPFLRKALSLSVDGTDLQELRAMMELELAMQQRSGEAIATVYEVASANLFFLPAGNKIKARLRDNLHIKELMLEGVCSIVEGMNPKMIRLKLEAFADGESGDAATVPASASALRGEAARAAAKG